MSLCSDIDQQQNMNDCIVETCDECSKAGSRVTPMSTQNLEQHEQEYVWYFTFGANMNDNTLRSRGLAPSCSLVGSLPGYRMTFTYNGYDLVEPCFANIELMSDASGSDSTDEYVVEGKLTFSLQ